MDHPSSSAEQGLTVHQRNLVDTCFEEGQYEAAISALDDIRSRKNKPFPAHVRQLIYIALYPPPSVEDQLEEELLKLEPGSPSKLLSRRHKSSLAPSPKATAAAQDLLMKFARTNAPENLACALPSYPENSTLPLKNVTDEQDSHIAQQALCVRNARCCWEIIREGFIKRGDGDVMPGPRKAKSRRSTRTQADDDDGWEGEDSAAPAPVSDHAWSVLGWILTLFESNEADTERTRQVRYSPLLLSQIPPSRPETAPRWDVQSPLDVAFHALQQERETQRSLGIRLLALLINLTSTTLVDFPMFLNAVSTRVSSLPIDALSSVFASLPVTHTVAQFKVMLCRHALGGSQAPSGAKPKPQARARAQPRRRTRTGPAEDDTQNTCGEEGARYSESFQHLAQAQDAGASAASALARQYPAISASDVFALLARPSKMDAASVLLPTLCLKAELVSNFGLAQQQLGENDKDAGWQGALRDGTLKKAVADMFDSARGGASDSQSRDYIRTRRDTLLAFVSVW